MLQFSCNFCGKIIHAPEQTAGRKGTCPACGKEVIVPLADPSEAGTPVIRVEPGPEALGASGAASSRDLPPGRYRLAEASVRMWKHGGLADQKGDHDLDNFGLDGLRVVYGLKKKAGTIVSAPRTPPWGAGAKVDVALEVGAFATPLKFVAEIDKITERPGGIGCDVDLHIIDVNDETRRKMEMLAERDDLRMRKKKGLFGGT